MTAIWRTHIPILAIVAAVFVIIAACGEVVLRLTGHRELRERLWVFLFIGTGIVVVLGTIASLLMGSVK